jgi:hypothetical protein
MCRQLELTNLKQCRIAKVFTHEVSCEYTPVI